MKPFVATFCVILLAIPGCSTTPSPRVVRASFVPDSTRFAMAVSRLDSGRAEQADFLDSLRKLSLKHGDIILLERGDSFRSIPDEILRRLFSLCSDRSVGLYFYPTTDLATGVFGISVYHWASRYDRPYDLDATYFFLDGKPLGKGKL